MQKMRAKMISVGLLGAAILLPIDLAKADQLGHASWYSLPSNRTANGERMNPNELTAAHRSLPFGTKVLVENLANGSSVIVRINDRGPFVGGRIIDLSKAAAASIGMINTGTAKVRVTPVGGSGTALAALGAATAKAKANAKAGASISVAAKVDIPATDTRVKTVAYKGATTTRAAKLSSRTKHASKRHHSRDKVRLASASKSFARRGDRARFARHSRGIRAAAFEASKFSGRRVLVASKGHRHGVFGRRAAFMKSARLRRAG